MSKTGYRLCAPDSCSCAAGNIAGMVYMRGLSLSLSLSLSIYIYIYCRRGRLLVLGMPGYFFYECSLREEPALTHFVLLWPLRCVHGMQAMAVTKNASAYWLADADNEVLQRVYGISFPDKKDLKTWKEQQKLAEERNHRRLGEKQKLFFFHELSPGCAFFLPKGTPGATLLPAARFPGDTTRCWLGSLCWCGQVPTINWLDRVRCSRHRAIGARVRLQMAVHRLCCAPLVEPSS